MKKGLSKVWHNVSENTVLVIGTGFVAMAVGSVTTSLVTLPDAAESLPPAAIVSDMSNMSAARVADAAQIITAATAAREQLHTMQANPQAPTPQSIQAIGIAAYNVTAQRATFTDALLFSPHISESQAADLRISYSNNVGELPVLDDMYLSQRDECNAQLGASASLDDFKTCTVEKSSAAKSGSIAASFSVLFGTAGLTLAGAFATGTVARRRWRAERDERAAEEKARREKLQAIVQQSPEKPAEKPGLNL